MNRTAAEKAARELREKFYIRRFGNDPVSDEPDNEMADIIERAGGQDAKSKDLHEAWQAWLEHHGVPISMEFVRLANAVGEFTELARAAGKQDNIDTCIVCGKEIPPGPDCCSVKCVNKYMQFILTGKKKMSKKYKVIIIDIDGEGLDIAILNDIFRDYFVVAEEIEEIKDQEEFHKNENKN